MSSIQDDSSGNPVDLTAALRKLTSELSLAEARERRRIADDLHDHLGQYLALIRMKISTFQSNTIFCGHEQDLIEIQRLLDKAISFTRNLTMVISPPILYELGLIPALEWLSDHYSKRYKLNIHFRKSEPVVDVHEDIRGVIYRSMRELLLNVVKHAAAKNVEFIVEGNSEWLTMTLIDDGEGFDTTKSQSNCDSGYGLFSIRERLQYLGGSLKVFSEPGQGTRVVFRCPIRKKLQQ